MALFGFHLLDFILHFRVTWASPTTLPRVILTTLTLSQELKKLYATVSGISLARGLAEFHSGGPVSPQEDHPYRT